MDARRGRMARDVETINDILGRRTVAQIARRIGRSPGATRSLIGRHGLYPTQAAGYVTAQTLAREFVALSPQRVSALCRNGAIPARRNMTHVRDGVCGTSGGRERGWWLISLDHVPDLQARYGARGEPVRWRPGTAHGMGRTA